MAAGSFMGKTFTVSSKKILTPSNLSGSTGADFAAHERVGKKARSQYLGPKLKSYSLDLLLRAQDGVNPRSILKYFQKKSEEGKADYFVVGRSPLSQYPFKITDVSDEWDAVIVGGALVECKITLKIEEYL